MDLTFIIIAAVLPALVLIYFIYRKDRYEKEPAAQLVKGFGFGALSAMASFCISIPFLLIGLYPEETTTFIGQLCTALFGAAVPEELAKFLFLWLLLRRNKHFNEHVDGIVYSVCIGMGFAAFENIGYLLGNLEQWVSVGAIRAIVSIPGHFFFAVSMGYFYSNACFGNPANAKRNYSLAVLVPILLHAAFDACLMVSDGFGIAGAALSTFIGLYIYMAVISKARFETQLKYDNIIRTDNKLIQDENVEDVNRQ